MHVKTNKSFFLTQKGQKTMFNFKLYAEKRAEYVKKMQDIMDLAEVEERAMTKEEEAEFNDLEGKIRRLDSTVDDAKRARDIFIDKKDPAKTGEKRSQEEQEQEEVRAFCNYVRGSGGEVRADVMPSAENGAVIPKTIINKIIEKVYDVSPVIEMADRYDLRGQVNLPYYDDSESDVDWEYHDEATDLEAKSGKFKAITLTGFLGGSLIKVPKSLLNGTDLAIMDFLVKRLSQKFARGVEKEMLKGTPNKMTGMAAAKNVVTAASATEITLDEVIDLQDSIPDAYQNGAIFICNSATRTALRKLKDKDGRYILEADATARWKYRLFGNELYVSDNMDKMAAGNIAMYFVDMSGIALKIEEGASIEILRELFARSHCIGADLWASVDCKIADEQKIAALKMAAA